MYIVKKKGHKPNIMEYIIGASIVMLTFVILLLLGYFENNMLYIGVTLLLIIIVLLVVYFIGYHGNEEIKKPITGKIN